MLKLKKIVTGLALTSTVLANAWANNGPAIRPDTSPHLLAKVSNQYGAKVLKEVVKGSGEENVFFSPISLQLALDLLYAGADGHTKEAIEKAFGLPNYLVGERFHYANKLLIERLTSNRKDLTLSINNAVFLDERLPVREEYVSLVKSSYGAHAQNLDFAGAADEAAKTINDWASEATRKRITKVISKDVAAQLSALLANATYFYGKWNVEFDKKKTVKEPFQLGNGKEAVVDSMKKVEKLPYANVNGAQVVSLPFVDHGSDLIVVLPPAGIDSTAKEWITENVLEKDYMSQVTRNLDYNTTVSLSLPKFKFSTSMELSSTLAKLGLADLFAAPNLTKLSPANLAVGFVKQDTFVQVDEHGAEAAAVTTIGIVRTSIQPSKFAKMQINRPFFFAIRDRKLGAVLFAGIVENPVWE